MQKDDHSGRSEENYVHLFVLQRGRGRVSAESLSESVSDNLTGSWLNGDFAPTEMFGLHGGRMPGCA